MVGGSESRNRHQEKPRFYGNAIWWNQIDEQPIRKVFAFVLTEEDRELSVLSVTGFASSLSFLSITRDGIGAPIVREPASAMFLDQL